MFKKQAKYSRNNMVLVWKTEVEPHQKPMDGWMNYKRKVREEIDLSLGSDDEEVTDLDGRISTAW